MKPVRIGVVGCGGIATGLHLPVIAALPVLLTRKPSSTVMLPPPLTSKIMPACMELLFAPVISARTR